MSFTALTEGKGAVALANQHLGNLQGPWAALTGGQRTVEITKIPPGHMQPPILATNPPQVDNIIIRRVYDSYSHDLKPQMDAAMDRGDLFAATRLFLDDQNHVYGRGDTYGCLLTRVTAPDYDSTGNGTGYLELEFVSNGIVTR